MHDLLIIFMVILVLLTLVSIMGGSIHPPNKSNDDTLAPLFIQKNVKEYFQEEAEEEEAEEEVVREEEEEEEEAPDIDYQANIVAAEAVPVEMTYEPANASVDDEAPDEGGYEADDDNNSTEDDGGNAGYDDGEAYVEEGFYQDAYQSLGEDVSLANGAAIEGFCGDMYAKF